ncbi:Rieske (2Fe-2S) protein [Streptomyces sp. NPDC049954]|uniref:Rieske (2Fe-2S) protein n=1 Tax=Streptomyces sp. NPDC049954 TaxID=3155779 RepID=UPI00343D2D60
MTVLQGSGAATSRRTFVAAAGASGLAVALAACGGSGGSSSSQSARSSGGGGTLGPTSEIPEGGGKIFTDEKVVVTQPRKGEFKAFTSTCTHAGCQVGSVSGGTINCPCHGSKFSIEDGSVKAPPASSALEEQKIEVKGGSISLA